MGIFKKKFVSIGLALSTVTKRMIRKCKAGTFGYSGSPASVKNIIFLAAND